jgi:hypothetical protein
LKEPALRRAWYRYTAGFKNIESDAYDFEQGYVEQIAIDVVPLLGPGNACGAQ